MKNIFFNTIVSLVTAPISQNIAIIRISGPKTYKIINKIFNKKINNDNNVKNQIIFGKILDNKRKIVDEVLLFCFYKPHSFTGEDLIEVSCHGNLFIVNKIIKLIIENGAELAERGEFTKKAFFNKKINIIQSNAINDLIHSPSDLGTKIALHNLNKNSKNELEIIEEKMLEIIANIKVNIDYPEYDGVEYLTKENAYKEILIIKKKLEKLKKSGKIANIYQEGLKIAIIGKPNVGKSTLFNTLLKREKSIVTEIEGTTRDIIEVNHNFNGIPLILLDTAGIHEANNKIEKIGIKKSLEALDNSEVIFFLVDNSQEWSKEDEKIYQIIKKKNKKYLIIINKSDIKKKIKIPHKEIKKIIEISAKNKQISELEKKINKWFGKHLVKNIPDHPYLAQNWQIVKLNSLSKKIKNIMKEIKKGTYLDAICGDLEIIYNSIKELSGKNIKEEIIDIIFSKFCLGK